MAARGAACTREVWRAYGAGARESARAPAHVRGVAPTRERPLAHGRARERGGGARACRCSCARARTPPAVSGSADEATNGRRTRPADGGVVDLAAAAATAVADPAEAAAAALLDRYFAARGVRDAAARAALGRVGGGGNRAAVLAALRAGAGAVNAAGTDTAYTPEALASRVALLEALLPLGESGVITLASAHAGLLTTPARALGARAAAVAAALAPARADAAAAIAARPELLAEEGGAGALVAAAEALAAVPALGGALTRTECLAAVARAPALTAGGGSDVAARAQALAVARRGEELADVVRAEPWLLISA